MIYGTAVFTARDTSKHLSLHSQRHKTLSLTHSTLRGGRRVVRESKLNLKPGGGQAVRSDPDVDLRHHVEECADKATLAKGLEKEIRGGRKNSHGDQTRERPRQTRGVETGEVAQDELQARQVTLPQEELKLQPHCVAVESHREGSHANVLVHQSGEGEGQHRCTTHQVYSIHTHPHTSRGASAVRTGDPDDHTSDWSVVRIYPRFLRLIGPS
eukprot:9266278-Pyramimonas_sp.AAC.1